MANAKFYCENCRKEVKSSAKVCPHCGRFFTAVKCPMCGFTADGKLFTLGCPSCGYSGDTGMAATPAVETFDADDIDEGRRRSSTYRRKERSGIPSWVFPLTILIMLGAFAVLVLVYLNL